LCCDFRVRAAGTLNGYRRQRGAGSIGAAGIGAAIAAGDCGGVVIGAVGAGRIDKVCIDIDVGVHVDAGVNVKVGCDIGARLRSVGVGVSVHVETSVHVDIHVSVETSVHFDIHVSVGTGRDSIIILGRKLRARVIRHINHVTLLRSWRSIGSLVGLRSQRSIGSLVGLRSWHSIGSLVGLRSWHSIYHLDWQRFRRSIYHLVWQRFRTPFCARFLGRAAPFALEPPRGLFGAPPLPRLLHGHRHQLVHNVPHWPVSPLPELNGVAGQGTRGTHMMLHNVSLVHTQKKKKKKKKKKKSKCRRARLPMIQIRGRRGFFNKKKSPQHTPELEFHPPPPVNRYIKILFFQWGAVR
jgi:hypothetical protein